MLKTIDLFAGVGGMRLAFEQAGFTTVYANDKNPKCKVTYDANFNDVKLTVKDITDKENSVVSDIEATPYNVLLSGFPCQPFSQAGYRQGFQDEQGRGDVFFYIAEILERTNPDAFLLENVKNLQTHDKGRTYQIIERTLQEIGYTVTSQVLDTSAYTNIPQNRHRIFIVGFKNSQVMDRFRFPLKEPKMLSFSDVLLPSNEVDDYYYYENKPIWERMSEYKFEVNNAYQWRRKYVRQNKSGVFPTLTANMGTGGHNVPLIRDDKGVRKLTPRECFRLQGFPDSYVLPKLANSHLYTQAGNSVTVPLVTKIATKMKLAIESAPPFLDFGLSDSIPGA